ncbi:glycerate dehydrogenase [Marinomonas ushuaiensis DSM 15871]|uniref:Glycerate dehydrogenase n=1 Tax=Marinomonas ushuaiensis DSM 15871 TaxID=1122207 RepID=X7E5Z3_9GAMM|nr:D-2-hydroxyacid dehydrogenase [Marinomonas ushuaiensis]ETX11464.1 glycerate dehydrogenase [Marinomonas ushuaiensis DSM 15871]
MKAVFLDRGSFPDSIDIELPTLITEVVEYQNTQSEQVAERIKDADIVLTNKVVLNEESIAKATSLKLVQVMATGINNVDTAACKKQGITVQNVAGYSINSVPEHTFSMLLALKRNLISYIEDVKSGKWSSSEHFCFLDYPIQDLHSTNMVIVGGGSLGKKVAEISKAFGMKVTFAERKGAKDIRIGYTNFESALKMADVISVNCPLTEDTKNLIGDAEFALMKPNALLLNISRGGIVDENALLKAFEKQAIAGAAFDVSTQEPMPLDHPLHQLSKYPNFLLTPHIAWASNEAMQKLADIALQKITAFVDTIE